MDNPLELKIPVVIKPTDITHETRAIDGALIIEIPLIQKDNTAGELWLNHVMKDNPAMEDLKNVVTKGYPDNIGAIGVAISAYEYQKRGGIAEPEQKKIEHIKKMLETFPKRAKQNPNSIPTLQQCLDKALQDHINTIKHKNSALTKRKPSKKAIKIHKLLGEDKHVHSIAKEVDCDETTVRRQKKLFLKIHELLGEDKADHVIVREVDCHESIVSINRKLFLEKKNRH